jgi:hypothetical protein
MTLPLVYRLKPLMPLLGGPEQSGCVEGRQIMDNIILDNEVFHSLKSTRTMGILFKLDISMVFDKLSWHYIKEILFYFVLYTSWVKWIL